MQFIRLFKRAFFMLSVFLLLFDNMWISMFTFISVNLLMAVTAIMTIKHWKNRILATISFCLILCLQLCFTVFIVDEVSLTLIQNTISVVISYLLLALSYGVGAFIGTRSYQEEFFNDVNNMTTLLYSDLEEFNQLMARNKNRLNKANEIITLSNINTVIAEVRRHNPFQYHNQGTLSDAYFDVLNDSLNDPYMYIVLSDTGSVPSQMISLVTEKDYNHVSISFDRKLKTLISYNGGERVNPPGLNGELLRYLAKKEDATIYVYQLSVTTEQKQKMIDKVTEINTCGSAYNLLGSTLINSIKPNIMYCSQFVYSLLQHGGAVYFKKGPKRVKPTDFIELDYDRKLSLAYKIKF